MEGARFEGGVERRTTDTVPPHTGATRRSDLRVIFAWAHRMAAPQELALVHDRATDPRVIPGGPARKLRLLDREAHPPLVLVPHLIASVAHFTAVDSLLDVRWVWRTIRLLQACQR